MTTSRLVPGDDAMHTPRESAYNGEWDSVLWYVTAPETCKTIKIAKAKQGADLNVCSE